MCPLSLSFSPSTVPQGAVTPSRTTAAAASAPTLSSAAPPPSSPYDHAAFVSFLAPDQRLRDLREATLDGMVLRDIDFAGADLRGANLSDVRAVSCSFQDADLVDMCLADSVFDGCDFRHARLAGVTLTGARFTDCRFAGRAALMLPWDMMAGHHGNTYETRDGDILSLDIPPLVLLGFGADFAMLEGKILMDDSIIG